MQRDRDKQERAREKQEKRAARAAERSEGADDDDDGVDEAAVMHQLAALQEAYDDGKVELEEFMRRREELQQQLM